MTDYKKLISLRHTLLELHTELLEITKRRFEAQFGKVKTTGEYFQLVTTHADFQWIRWLSILIASIDELIDKGEGDDQIQSLRSFVKSQLTPREGDPEFAGNYFETLQTVPEIAVAHGKVMKILAEMDKKHRM